MSNIREPVDSILELLTCRNPTVHHTGPKSKTNTTNRHYHFPTQVREWEELQDFDVLAKVFGGELLKEALQARKLHPPLVRNKDNLRLGSDEPNNRQLIEKWNQEVVMSAIDPIKGRFHPVIWEKGEAPDDADCEYESPEPPEKQREQPGRKCTPKSTPRRKHSYAGFKPDSGSVSSNPTSEKDAKKEKFVKEYKVATKWKSRWIRERGLVNESGKWNKEMSRRNPAGLPVIQTFTYCVQNMCRYGCILTCEEAFIFRVRPIAESPVSQSSDPVRAELAKNGLLEYVSIPWEIHFERRPDACDTWTMNLALWFIHVLAGNEAGVNWAYPRLEIETNIALISSASQEVPLPSVSQDSEDSVYEENQDEVDAANKVENPILSATGTLPMTPEAKVLAKRKWGMGRQLDSDTEENTDTEEEEQTETDDRFLHSFDAKRRFVQV
ncbi:unnamed protein product [Clonostachys rosea]|uniref:HNH nuclease domain-containing protein n=1 Tax=Bionectria ochroleuca TaxID=29856 RepID=A0ABY6UXE5_BIOOC|nr:unnamed protein product [Clonostachys rosea]